MNMVSYLFEVIDPRGNLVRLAQKQFEEHIISSHPEIKSSKLIEICVVDPDFITKDADIKLREVYFRQGIFPDNPQRYIKVVVEGANVITAYRQGRVKEGEKVIWQPSET